MRYKMFIAVLAAGFMVLANPDSTPTEEKIDLPQQVQTNNSNTTQPAQNIPIQNQPTLQSV